MTPAGRVEPGPVAYPIMAAVTARRIGAYDPSVIFDRMRRNVPSCISKNLATARNVRKSPLVSS